MILRRFMKHFTDQNWFAVGLDVIVVIVGIFLGLQVQAWNEERQERVQEQVYLNRLHTDIMEAVNFNDINFNSIILAPQFYDFNQHLQEVLDVFDGIDSHTNLSTRHCFAIMASHIYNSQANDIPTLRELTSSGQLSLIESEKIKLALSRFTFALEGINTLVNALVPTSLVLARKYPDLIRLDRKMRDVDADPNFNHQCNFEEMRDNQQFNNDLIDNATRMNTFVLTLSKQREIIETVHKELDKELSITHEGDTQ